ncbi:MAG: glycosyltransferase family 2 protein [Actinomycetota bacterium]
MRCVAIVPAYNNQSTISETVRALADDDRVDEVIVVDDGSADQTAALAETAGARVLRQSVNRGKHVVLEKGMTEAGEAVLLMVDADTGSSAKAAIALVAPVAAGKADMVIGILPSAEGQGGFGLVKGTAAWLIKAVSGFESVAPMSGQRALNRQVFEACRPLSEGFAVDAMLTAKAARKGFRLLELPVEMTHDHTGRTMSGFLHRGRQGYHVLKAFLPALVRRS